MGRRITPLRVGIAGTAALVLVTLAGCTGSSGGKSSGSAGGREAAGPAAAGPASVSSAAGSAAGKVPAAGGTGQNARGLDDAPLGAAQIRTAELTVAVTGAAHVAAQADAAESVVDRAGGEIDSDDRTSGAHATATLRVRVPPEQLQPVLTALSRLGHERSRTSSTTDVTERVADVSSRVASARGSIDRLRTLYGSARKVADVIAIEDELSSREADLESLEAQQRALARQTAMATVTLELVTAPKAVTHRHHHRHRTGFVGGLARGWHGFVTAAAWLATALATVLPFLAVLAVLALAARLLGLRLPRRRTLER
jgi:hypothetical protein